MFAKTRCETVETGIVKYDAEEAAEVAILSRDCMKHLGDWYYPEGGWGWVVVTVSVLTTIMTQGLVLGGGQVMVSMINTRLGLEQTHVTGVLVTTGTLVSGQLWSPLTSHIVNTNSPRLCAFIAGLVMSLSLLFTSFASQLHQIIISYCLMFSLGISLTEVSLTVMRGQYFKKRRLHLEIIINSSTGVGVSLMSLVQLLCLHTGGWRLGLQILSGVFSLCILTSLLLRPASVYHPQRRAILHMRQYMRAVLGKTQRRGERRSMRDLVTRLRHRSVRVVMISGCLSSVCLLTPVLIGSSLAELSHHQTLLLQLSLGCSYALGSYCSGRLCLYRHSSLSVRSICVTITLVSALLMLLVQTISTISLQLILCSLLAGVVTCCSKVFLYKSARSVESIFILFTIL